MATGTVLLEYRKYVTAKIDFDWNLGKGSCTQRTQEEKRKQDSPSQAAS
jgi:hypothetical protein